jgi:hypothetical protein
MNFALPASKFEENWIALPVFRMWGQVRQSCTYSITVILTKKNPDEDRRETNCLGISDKSKHNH